MKKLLLILSITLFVSCSSDDDSNENNDNSIYGTWKPYASQSYNPETDETTELTYFTDCAQNSRYTFKSNGDLIITSYSRNVDNECILRSENEVIDWRIVSEGVLYIEDSDSDFYYQVNENELRIEEIDDYNDDTNDIVIYKRI
ncbi:hypothetical protein [Joostella sp. CR20]|uniref:hypothetical protein n=1 Tax=Joostella sp. CR20 TaxID=2804312 RepID=UPI00313BC611